MTTTDTPAAPQDLRHEDAALAKAAAASLDALAAEDPFGADLDHLLGGLRDLAQESRDLAAREDEPRIRSLYSRDASHLTYAFGRSLLLRGKHRKAVRDALREER